MYWIRIWLTNQNHGLHKSNIVNDRRWIFYIYRRIPLTKENKWFGCVSVVFRRFSMSFLPIDMSFFYKRIGAYFSTKCFYLKKKVTVKHPLNLHFFGLNAFHHYIFYTCILYYWVSLYFFKNVLKESIFTPFFLSTRNSTHKT